MFNSLASITLQILILLEFLFLFIYTIKKNNLILFKYTIFKIFRLCNIKTDGALLLGLFAFMQNKFSLHLRCNALIYSGGCMLLSQLFAFLLIKPSIKYMNLAVKNV